MALKALRIFKSPERARKVRLLCTVSPLFAHGFLPGNKRLERELPRWAELRHQNILPLYGMCTPRTLPGMVSHGCAGIVTDIKPRLYMVSGRSHVGR